MAIYQTSLFGSASIGVYSLATEKILILPKFVPVKKAEKLSYWLGVKLVHTNIGGSILVGSLACANSNGILLPHYVREEEVEAIKSSFDGNIAIMETKKTAYGNMVLANDYGAVVDPRLKPVEIRKISETLGVEAVPCEIAQLPYVGSLAVATNKGVLAHPLLRDSERKILEDALKVPVDVGTVNCGIPYVGTGLVCNSRAALVGSLTTGPEMFIIGHALGVMKEDERVESFQSYRRNSKAEP
ncbi:MAG: translation initiation factor IF-6 [Nitrososphaerota archaeon]|nr:translation initiation factor IF-6 [Candidatus Bathyarchaeota archaeon]MDW8022492.1 translation initiation factor IF-6 [Nitrososphaerota archaeon]